MYTEMSLKEALKYFMKGRKVLVLNEYDDKSISTERIEDCLPKEARYLVDVPATVNPEFEQAIQDMVESDQNDNDGEDEQLTPPDHDERVGKQDDSGRKTGFDLEASESGTDKERDCRTDRYSLRNSIYACKTKERA